MAPEWVDILATWVRWSAPPTCSFEVLKARMLRALGMPYGTIEGMWYRYVVCALECADSDATPSGTWSWHGNDSTTRACYYAMSNDEGDGFCAFLTECQRAYADLHPKMTRAEIRRELLCATRGDVE